MSVLGSEIVPWTRSVEDGVIEEHPIRICETGSISCARLPPIRHKITHTLHDLSTFQRETVCRIIDSLQSCGGFVLGDGTGVGKGRVLAALVVEFGISSIWISSSGRLKRQAENEFRAVCGYIPANMVFTSYTSTVATQVERLLQFAKETPTLLILDECHHLRNCTRTKVVMDRVVSHCPYVVYSSATVASAPRHLLYMKRIGLWGGDGEFADFQHLRDQVHANGAGLLELITLHLCRTGRYLCRQLDTSGISMDVLHVTPTPEQEVIYKKCSVAFRNVAGKVKQSLFLKLLTLFKVRAAIAKAEEELEQGNSVIFSIVNTGEANFQRNDFSAQHSVQEYADSHGLAINLGPETIDVIIAHFGGDVVAEITGRTCRPAKNGGVERVPKDEVIAFQRDEKRVAILSRAGGTGISLNDKVGDHPRVHIVLETPWSAEDFLQQMGRAHRSDSRSNPRYVFVTTTIFSEHRLATSILAKLKHLGAVCKADRDAFKLPIANRVMWDAKTRSAAALQLALARRLPDVALEEVEMDPSAAAPVRNRQQLLHDITRRLQYEAGEEEEDVDETHIWREAARDATTYFPQLVIPTSSAWTPRTHKYYSAMFKRQVMTFLLCCRHSALLNSLPLTVVEMIIEFMSTVQLGHVIRSICEWTRLGSSLTVPTNDGILNDILAMPVRTQDTFVNLLNSHSTGAPSQQRTILKLDDYAQNRVGVNGASVKICNICALATPDEHGSSHVVEMAYSMDVPYEPPETARFWTCIHSKRMFYTNAAEECFSIEGRRCLFDPVIFQESSRIKWTRFVERRRQRHENTVRAAARYFHVATDEALRLYSDSGKKIVRAEHGGIRLIGLLVHIQ